MKTIAPTLRRSLRLQVLILATLLPGLSILPVPLQANPTGPNVVSGAVGFDGLGTGTLNINQGTNTAIIDWQTFSIAAGEVTNFNQPGINAIALNRVVTGNPSAIYGTLSANGSVIVVNPNGIVVGPNGIVDVAGMLTMTTLDIDNDDFLDGGSMTFRGDSGAGITNYGAITSQNGDVVLLGNFLQNPGTVTANNGTVAFGAGGDIVLEQGVSGATISVRGASPNGGGINHSGTVNAAAVQFETTGNAASLGIQNTGVVRATGVSTRNGRVMLRAMGGSSLMNSGTVRAVNSDGSGGQIDIEGGDVLLEAGSLEAAGTNAAGGVINVTGNQVQISQAVAMNASGTIGGTVSVASATETALDGSIDVSGTVGNGGQADVTGDSVNLGSTAFIDASGAAGGKVRVGGGFQGNEADIANSQRTIVEDGSVIIADGAESNAGTVVIWSDDDTIFQGEISAQALGAVGNGGLVEVSGKDYLGFDGLVSTLSVNGRAGTLLLDPSNVTIGPTGNVSDAALVTALGLGHVVIHTDSNEESSGNITIQRGSNLLYNSLFDLSLFAHGTIFVNDRVQNAGDTGAGGNITLFAGWTGKGAERFVAFDPTIAQDPIPNDGTGGISFADLMIDAANPDDMPFGTFGNGVGNILLNFDAAGAVAVGSAYGETNLLGAAINIQGGNGNDRFAQVGFTDLTQNPTGDINVYAQQFINMDAGGGLSRVVGANNGGANGGPVEVGVGSPYPFNDTHVIIGHGGSDNGAQAIRSGDGDASGDIRVIAGGALIMRGAGPRGFSQIGHGGLNIAGEMSGDVTVEAQSIDMLASPYQGFIRQDRDANSAEFFDIIGYNNNHILIGHGGNNTIGAKSGNIVVVARDFIKGFASLDEDFNTTNGFVMIGHGGAISGVRGAGAGPDRDDQSHDMLAVDEDMEGNVGAIYVEAGSGGIHFRTGAMNHAFNMIGHGGRESHGNHRLTLQGDAAANAAQVAGIGMSGTLESGINIISGGDITFDGAVRTQFLLNNQDSTFNNDAAGLARANDNSFAQIGLGGWRTGGRFNGDINITGGGDFLMQGGIGNDAYVQIGHGGTSNTGGSNGNGGTGTPPPTLDPRNGHATLFGDITINVDGNFGMYSGTSEDRAYSMVGHGGFRRTADYILDDPNNPGNPLVVDDIHKGHHGDIEITAGGAVTFQAFASDTTRYTDVAGNNNFSMLGHGGIESMGDHHGDLTVNAGGLVTFAAGLGGFENYRGGTNDDYDGQQTGANAFAMMGHGGYLSGTHSARDRHTAGTNRSYLWNGNAEGNGIGVHDTAHITINSTGGGLDVLGVQTQGSMRDDHGPRLDVDPPPEDPMRMIDPLTRVVRSFALIGHGGSHVSSRTGGNNNQASVNDRAQADSTRTLGDININVAGPVNVKASALEQKSLPVVEKPDVTYNTENFAQIGHGGRNWQSSYVSNIFVNADGDVNLESGFGNIEFARIGTGGFASTVFTSGAFNGGLGTIDGSVTVLSGGSVNLQGNASSNENAPEAQRQFTWVQIGNGATQRDQTITGNVTVAAANDVTLTGSTGIRDGFTHIGHGGFAGTDANIDSADIRVTAGRDVILQSNNGFTFSQAVSQSNWAKIGHGDTEGSRTNSVGIWDGDIFVAAGRDVRSVGGMFGHADPDNGDSPFDSISGNTFIAAGRSSATPGSGSIIFEAQIPDDNPFGQATQTKVTNGSLGLNNDQQVRFYVPSLAENQIATGTRINGADYDRLNPAPVGDPIRTDEGIANEATLGLGANGEPTMVFTPVGDFNAGETYMVFVGDNQIAPPPEVPDEGDVGAGDPFVPPNILNPLEQSFLNTLFLEVTAVENPTENEYLYYTDAYGNVYLIGVALDDVVYETDEDGNYYYTFLEDSLDSVLGPNRFNGDRSAFEVLTREEAEEQLRQIRASQAGTSGGLTFYTYNPSTGQYSSLRLFGVPTSNLGIIQPEL